MAKSTFDIKSEATRYVYAVAGLVDLATEVVREAAADVQGKLTGVQKDVESRIEGVSKSVSDLDAEVLREQATTVFNSRVDAIAKDAKARREDIDARVAQLQDDAKGFPARFQSIVDENVASATSAYADLAKRGEILVSRVRGQESTKATVTAAKTTVAKAKTTKTQAKKAAPAKKTVAKKASTPAKKTAAVAKKAAPAAKKAATTAKKTVAKKSATPTSSAKATTTAAKKTAVAATTAVTEAAQKVGNTEATS